MDSYSSGANAAAAHREHETDRQTECDLFISIQKFQKATKRNLQELHVDPTGIEGTAGRDSTPLSSPASHFNALIDGSRKPCHL